LVNLSDSWVMPGLMDAHVHITSNHAYRFSNTMEIYTRESTTLRALRGVKNAKLLLNAGFTTIKEIGNDANYATAEIVKAIKYGWIEGPNIIYAGKIIAPYGGQVSNTSTEFENIWNYEYIDADTHDEIRKAIRKNVYFGATTIKLVAQNWDGNFFYTEDEIKTAVEEANKVGITVTAHVMGGKAAANVIKGGAAAIEHGIYLDDDNLKLMKQHGTYLVGTEFSFDNWYAYGMDSTIAKIMTDTVLYRLKRAHELEVPMAFGTDIIIDIAGMNRVESNFGVIQVWKNAGIPPMKTLKCMTYNTADLFRIKDHRGSISKGFIADIVAVSKSPLDDIMNLKHINFVMKEGKIIRND